MSPTVGDASHHRVAVLDDYQRVAASLADWQAGLPGAQVTFFHDHATGDALVERLSGYDVVVAMRERTPFDRDLFARLADLRLLVTTGMRNRSIDLDAARARGITVAGTRSTRWGTDELTWGLIFALLRQIPDEDADVRAGGWQTGLGTSVFGKKLGVVGLGNLGSKVAEVGRIFGMHVLAWSPNLTDERATAAGATLVPKLELFRTADVVSVHMVLAAGTRGLIAEPELRAMQHTAYLINTSRGPLIDEPTLIRALYEGWIAGAALDVFDQEPLPADHPLRTAPRTVLTPHLGYVTHDNYKLFFEDALEDIQAYVAGAPVRQL